MITGDFVTEDAGCGIVHCAPAFGEEDYKVCLTHGVIRKGEKLVCPIDDNGRYTSEVPDFAGKFVKDADKEITKLLKARGKMVQIGVVKHSYAAQFGAIRRNSAQFGAIRRKSLTASPSPLQVGAGAERAARGRGGGAAHRNGERDATGGGGSVG